MLQKTQGTYFKISALYFKIYALYFSPKMMSDFQQLIKLLYNPLFSVYYIYAFAEC